MHKQVQKQIDRAMMMVRQAFRGVVGRVNSKGPIQLLMADGLAGEDLRDSEQFQEYGFTSNPPAGTMTVVLPVNGRTSHGIIIATEHETYRLKGLETGEVALYTDEGARIVLKRGRIIQVDCDVYRVNCKTFEVNADEKSEFNTPTLTASEAVISKGLLTGEGGMAISGGDGASVAGTLTATVDVIADGVSTRRHKHPGDSGGTTDEPIPS